MVEPPAAAVTAPTLDNSISSTVPTSRQIGPYQIGALLGAGGIGEVYRARDTVLYSKVASKIVPAAAFTLDADRLAQFKHRRAIREQPSVSRLPCRLLP